MLNKDQASEREKFRTIYEMHLKKTYHFFESNSIPYIDIQYKQLLNESEQELKRLINFLELSTPIEELLSVIKVDLYRNKVN
jgi:hypothetical protein